MFIFISNRCFSCSSIDQNKEDVEFLDEDASFFEKNTHYLETNFDATENQHIAEQTSSHESDNHGLR